LPMHETATHSLEIPKNAIGFFAWGRRCWSKVGKHPEEAVVTRMVAVVEDGAGGAEGDGRGS
jgi:hypothetical protein